MAGVLYGMDRQCQDTAASMVMSILERDESHAGALQLYALIAKERGQLEEATRVLVRLLILDQDNADIKWVPRPLKCAVVCLWCEVFFVCAAEPST